ncbi:hypothetical protein J1N35_037141 [Gossypium stocksii]|uniref:Uncharacterized protein n=1 Tax=Gossypium stocksii TaxID=47602 RepID=A0A9D3UJG4_9ROSI|nr:hypothetical protein J1N35_037141 [Gossypium stocksii]
MACSIDHLRKAASAGCPLIDELCGRQLAETTHRRAPDLPRNQDNYHHPKHTANQYIYHGPQAVTVIQQPGGYYGGMLKTKQKQHRA